MPVDIPDTPIVSADWLAAHLDQPGLVIVDTRKADGHASAHIPGARKLTLDPLLHSPGQVVAPDLFAAEMVRLGIGPDTLVISYDDGNNLFGARLWWVLRHYGHASVRVLDGGWDAWVAAGLPFSDIAAPEPDPGAFRARIVPDLLAAKADVRAAIGSPDTAIRDVRGDAEWVRRAPTEMSMAGHVPGALHMVWTDAIDSETRLFRSAPELRTRFEGLRPWPQTEVIVFCQGGIRAAHAVVALSIAGFARVRNYAGSWAKWSREKMPAILEPDPAL